MAGKLEATFGECLDVEEELRRVREIHAHLPFAHFMDADPIALCEEDG